MKARRFVIELRGFYLDKADTILANKDRSATGEHRDPSQWVIKYLDFPRIHHILEAFDEDTSGFVTIAEVNRFTKMRPLDWRSVLRRTHPDTA